MFIERSVINGPCSIAMFDYGRVIDHSGKAGSGLVPKLPSETGGSNPSFDTEKKDAKNVTAKNDPCVPWK